jgi:hypothetical protein
VAGEEEAVDEIGLQATAEKATGRCGDRHEPRVGTGRSDGHDVPDGGIEP